ncbi:MAG TPA: RNA polymerase sigma factor [Candidatus Eisenbacteria bacterium]
MVEESGVPLTFWKEAYEEHGGAVLAFLTSRVRKRDDAEDLLQETFIRAIRGGSALRDDALVKPYLMTIAYRVMIDRSRKKRHLLLLDLVNDESAGNWEAVDASPSPEEEAHLSGLTNRVGEVLETLPAALAQAFRLAVLEQRSYKEIGDLHGWPMSRVRMNVYRARQKVIAALGPVLSESDS